jgi:Flp pilus assembly protein TadG
MTRNSINSNLSQPSATEVARKGPFADAAGAVGLCQSAGRPGAEVGLHTGASASRRPLLGRLGRFRLLASEEGQNLVESAFALLIFLALLFGAVEFSYAFYTYHCVADAAREASRWAAVRGSQSCTNVSTLPECNASSAQITTYVRGLGYPGVPGASLNVTTKWCTASSIPASWSGCSTSGSNAPGNQVQVTVSYSFPINLVYLKAASLNLTSTGSMVISQ